MLARAVRAQGDTETFIAKGFCMKLAQRLTNIFLFATLAACSGGGGGGTPSGGGAGALGGATSIDACDLLTNAEVVAAIGTTLEKVEKGSTADGTSWCHYYGNDTVILQKGITVLARIAPNAKERWEQHRALADDPVPVYGIGTEAFTSSKDPVMVTLYQDKVYLFVGPLYSNPAIDYTVVKPLAEKALTRALTL